MSASTPPNDPSTPPPLVVEKSKNPLVDWLKSNWLAVVLIVLAGVFIGQNTAQTEVKFLWTSLDAPLWMLFTVLLLIGLLSGLLVARRRAKRKEAAAADKAQSKGKKRK